MKDVIIVTGASGRIGSELVSHLAKQGYNLLITDIKKKRIT